MPTWQLLLGEVPNNLVDNNKPSVGATGVVVVDASVDVVVIDIAVVEASAKEG